MSNKFDERGFDGAVFFYKNVKYGYFTTSNHDISDEEYVLLGSVGVNVAFDVDIRQAEINIIEKKMGDLKARTEHQLNVMRGRIRELQALTHEKPQPPEVD